MIKLIAVGDPHIRPQAHRRNGVDSSEHLAQLVEHVNAHHPDAAYCLFLGDLTHEAEPEAYRRFQSLIAPLQVSPLLMIGNHDDRQNFTENLSGVRQDANGFIQFTADLGPNHRLIALDSLNGPPYDPLERHVGRLSPERLAFLEAELEAAAEKSVILAMHHQPLRIGLPGMYMIRLSDEAVFMTLVNRHANVEMVLFGHNHRNISGVVAGLPFNGFKSMDVQTPLDFEAMDPSAGIAEPPSYGVLLIQPDSIVVHFEDFTAGVAPDTSWNDMLRANPDMLTYFRPLVLKMMPEKLAGLDALLHELKANADNRN